jgi:hypothetical protein
VVVVGVRRNDQREEVALVRRPGKEGRGEERLEELRQLPRRGDVDDERAACAVLLAGRQEEELGVAVAHVEEEVDEILGVDRAQEAVAPLRNEHLRRNAPRGVRACLCSRAHLRRPGGLTVGATAA